MNNSVSTNQRVRRGAIGVLARGDEYLIVRRAAQVTKGGYWCFPGGHLEAGETSRHAVTRELAEELGIIVKPTTRLGSLQVPDSRHVLAVWLVHHVEGELAPAPHEIAEYQWLSAAGIRQLPMGLASNELVLKMLAH